MFTPICAVGRALRMPSAAAEAIYLRSLPLLAHPSYASGGLIHSGRPYASGPYTHSGRPALPRVGDPDVPCHVPPLPPAHGVGRTGPPLLEVPSSHRVACTAARASARMSAPRPRIGPMAVMTRTRLLKTGQCGESRHQSPCPRGYGEPGQRCRQACDPPARRGR